EQSPLPAQVLERRHHGEHLLEALSGVGEGHSVRRAGRLQDQALPIAAERLHVDAALNVVAKPGGDSAAQLGVGGHAGRRTLALAREGALRAAGRPLARRCLTLGFEPDDAVERAGQLSAVAVHERAYSGPRDEPVESERSRLLEIRALVPAGQLDPLN